MFVDSHCHINFPELVKDIDGVLANMAANQVTHALCVSVNLEQWPQIVELAQRFPNVFASVGVHPDQKPGEAQEPTVDELCAHAQTNKIVAIGETGLDYYWIKDEREWQRNRFRTHIRAARQAKLPLIVHTRDAREDTVRIMREEGAADVGGVMHCFTESWEVAAAAMEMNFFISFSGIVTFKNALELKEVARRVPLERMLIETDAPYLAPVPFRGKLNQPAYVKHVAEEIARLKQVSVEQVAQTTSANFFGLFRIAPQPASTDGGQLS